MKKFQKCESILNMLYNIYMEIGICIVGGIVAYILKHLYKV